MKFYEKNKQTELQTSFNKQNRKRNRTNKDKE
jgi:hypothetical protein